MLIQSGQSTGNGQRTAVKRADVDYRGSSADTSGVGLGCACTVVRNVPAKAFGSLHKLALVKGSQASGGAASVWPGLVQFVAGAGCRSRCRHWCLPWCPNYLYRVLQEQLTIVSLWNSKQRPRAHVCLRIHSNVLYSIDHCLMARQQQSKHPVAQCFSYPAVPTDVVQYY